MVNLETNTFLNPYAVKYKGEDPEEIQRRVDEMWLLLNKKGIYTMEDFEEAVKRTPIPDLSFMYGKPRFKV